MESMPATPTPSRRSTGLIQTPFGCLVLLIVTVVVCGQLVMWAFAAWPGTKPQPGARIR